MVYSMIELWIPQKKNDTPYLFFAKNKLGTKFSNDWEE